MEKQEASFPRVGVNLFVIRNLKELLMVKIGENWFLPKGPIRPFEKMEVAAAGHVLLQAGVFATAKGVIFVTQIVEPQNEHRIEIYMTGELPDGEEGTIICPDSTMEAQWIDVRDLYKFQDKMDDETVNALSYYSKYLQAMRPQRG